MSKKKIVHLIKTLERGGTEMSLLRMLPLLCDIFEHTIVTLESKGTLAEKFEKAGITVLAIEQKNLWDVISYGRLHRVLQKISPDLIITNLLHADIVGRFFVQFFVRCKVISSIVTTYNFKSYWLPRFFERTTKNLATGYMANSETVKKTFVEKFGVAKEKISVIPTGIDVTSFVELAEKENLREKLGITTENRVVICVANFHPNKGHRYLLEAFEALYHKYKNIKLILIGIGKEEASLKRQVQEYLSKNNILFLGERADIPRLLSLSYVFVLPTFFEGMSNAIMEAMACGLPVITTDIIENRELITHEKTGLLCPLQDTLCLTRLLDRVFSDSTLAQTLGRNASAAIQEKYGLPAMTQLWRNYFSFMSQK